jgi:phosphate transport system permease protein
VLAIDAALHDDGGVVFARHADGTFALAELQRSENPFTGEVEEGLQVHVVPFEAHRADAPQRVLVLGAGDRLMAVWPDGDAVRFDARDPSAAKAAERLDLVEGAGTVRALDFLIGRNTLLVGESTGKIGAWFGTKPESGPRPADGVVFVRGHEFEFGSSPVVALASSARNRGFLAGSEDGTLRLCYATSGKLVAEVALREAGAIDSLAIAPKDDAIVASHRAGLSSWTVDLGHPEATLAALFAPVWYEGYPRADHTWQSSSGSDDFEPKFGLLPLVFGTLKATLYSMLFGVPLALLAAIYTSEFLSPRLRAPLKSMTEMMASLPSVVLGFIAALVIAPLVKDLLPSLLAMLVTVPFMLLLGAHLWQMQRTDRIVRWSGLPRFAATAAMLPAGAALGLLCGGLLQDLLFGGDLVGWLSGGRGGALGGFFVLLLPASMLLVGWLSARHAAPWLRRRSKGWSRRRIAAVDLLKFLAGTLVVLLVALLGGWILSSAGFDARGGVLDTYVQRNALIVGFVMGFAVIPIIYTLAEDALSSVPAHLRLASLGAGATPWQTASRVVVPTAMSGLFSALMIGLGRAVGETMIVLMAAGNTPLTSWNIFNGFRTLSANIAVELPEAVRDSTHYRTLFLAGLCLFAMTFVLNTLAEVVRQRVRRRSYQL